MMRWKTRN